MQTTVGCHCRLFLFSDSCGKKFRETALDPNALEPIPGETFSISPLGITRSKKLNISLSNAPAELEAKRHAAEVTRMQTRSSRPIV